MNKVVDAILRAIQALATGDKDLLKKKPQPANSMRLWTMKVNVPGAKASFWMDENPAKVWSAVADASGTLTFQPSGAGRGVGGNLDITAEGYKPFHARFQSPLNPVGPMGVELVAGGPQTNSVVLEEAAKARTGLVVQEGKSVRDDQGLFHPLGVTFFWAVWGEKFDRDRFDANLKWLWDHGQPDYVRILATVGWEGQEMDPTWPDYEQVLGATIDHIYSRGMRCEVVVLGGSKPGWPSPLETAQIVARVCNARPEKIIGIECANEYNVGAKVELADVVEMGKWLRANTPFIIALSSPGDFEEMQRKAKEAGVQAYSIHTDRNDWDFGWRQVRQGWDFKDIPFIVWSNEPPGPHSSVSVCHSPLLLTMMRAVGVACGGAYYVLHIGDMVTGLDNDAARARNRKANLWEIDDVDIPTILKSLRGLDAFLPPGIEGWTRINGHWTSPTYPVMSPDVFWGAGADEGHGVQRAYSARSGNTEIQLWNGIYRFVECTANYSAHIKVYDPVTKDLVFERDINPGDKVRLQGSEDRQTGYILVAEFK